MELWTRWQVIYLQSPSNVLQEIERLKNEKPTWERRMRWDGMKAVFGGPPSLLWCNPLTGLRRRRLMLLPYGRRGGSEFSVWEETGSKTVCKAEFLARPRLELKWTPPYQGCAWCVCQGETGWSSGIQVHHNPWVKPVFKLSHAGVDPTPLTSTQNNCNISSNLTSIFALFGFW